MVHVIQVHRDTILGVFVINDLIQKAFDLILIWQRNVKVMAIYLRVVFVI